MIPNIRQGQIRDLPVFAIIGIVLLSRAIVPRSAWPLDVHFPGRLSVSQPRPRHDRDRIPHVGDVRQRRHVCIDVIGEIGVPHAGKAVDDGLEGSSGNVNFEIDGVQ